MAGAALPRASERDRLVEARAAPLVEAVNAWLKEQRVFLSAKPRLAEKIAYVARDAIRSGPHSIPPSVPTMCLGSKLYLKVRITRRKQHIPVHHSHTLADQEGR